MPSRSRMRRAFVFAIASIVPPRPSVTTFANFPEIPATPAKRIAYRPPPPPLNTAKPRFLQVAVLESGCGADAPSAAPALLPVPFLTHDPADSRPWFVVSGHD